MSDIGNPEPFEHPHIPLRFNHEAYDVSDPRLVVNFEGRKREYIDPIPVT